MYRSPPNLRSGSKGKSVPLSSVDKRKVERSLSASSAGSTTTMPADNTGKAFDPTFVDSCVTKYLSGDDMVNKIVTKLTAQMKGVIEEAVRTAMVAVNKEISELRDKVEKLTGKLGDLDEKLADRTDELEQYQRRNNVRMFGVNEAQGEDTDNIVRELCRDKLGVELPVDAICRSHRVGRQRTTSDGRVLPRPIIVRFVSYRDRRRVFGAKKSLKGSGVTIREDLTARRTEVFRKAVAMHGPRNTWTHDGRVLWVASDGKKGVAVRLSDLKGTPRSR